MTSTSPKKWGNGWENDLVKLVQLKGWVSIRIPDSCKRIGRGKIVPIRSPFDFCFAKNGVVVFADAKTLEGPTFANSSCNRSQLAHLIALETAARCVAGYVVFHRSINRVIFYRASILWALRPGNGLRITDGIDLGSLHDLDLERVLILQNAAARGI